MADSSSCPQPSPGWEVHSQYAQSPYYGYKHFYGQAGPYETETSQSRSESNGTVSSPLERDHEDEEQQSTAKTVGESKKKKKAQKLKQEVDKAAHLLKRRGQNRASQRAFRERKERHTKELEIKVTELVNLLEFANRENSVAQSQIVRMENELSYYRHLLFASQTRNDNSISTSDTSNNSSFSRSRKAAHSNAFGPSVTSGDHVTNPFDTFDYSTDPPACSTSSTSIATVRDEHSTSSTDRCGTPADNFGYPYSPSQSSTSAISGSQTFAGNFEDITWGLNAVSWSTDDSVFVDSQAMAYQQQSSTVWAGSWD